MNWRLRNLGCSRISTWMMQVCDSTERSEATASSKAQTKFRELHEAGPRRRFSDVSDGRFALRRAPDTL